MMNQGYKIAGLLMLIICLPALASAQVCGPSVTKIYVFDGNGKTITNAKIEFPDIRFDMNATYGEWKSFKDDAYFLRFDHGKPYDQNRMRISAEGFATVELKIRITEAQRQTFRVVLSHAGAKNAGSVVQLFSLWGEVKHEGGSGVPDVEVILTDDSGEKIRTFTDEKGGYYAEARTGSYRVEYVRSDRSASISTENFTISERGKHLDVVLPADRLEGTSDSQITCTPHQYLAREFDCVLARRSINK